MMILSRSLISTACVALASPAFAHLHINMDASSGVVGTPLEISFYGNTSPFSITDTGSRLEFQDGDGIFTYTTDTTVGSQYEALIPGLAGYQRAAMTNFSLDGLGADPILKAPGDRRTDPNAEPFGFQILDVVDVATGNSLGDEYRVLWQHFSGHGGLSLPGDYNGYTTFSADSSADDVIGRSYIMSLGTHAHGGADPNSGFFLLTDAPNGEYDISLSATDFEGHFADSVPVTFRLNVVPEPASLALMGLGGIVLLRRRR